ncbi:MAG: DNA-binding response regulator [Flammeovirgaceae bacterium]|nr:DNA-binding response regulator [Flammeovirgaceae bacterium]MBR06344.1 DNA-binding response regulator [Rickettsiales bacterium]HCX22517.1 DNA-binding response regulator [Cytophagales bacterium]|tara:strand:- start:767 stop:1432 length:666 start_codon:yes stop_codon:yes gene_type:complete
MIKVALADDHEIVRYGIKMVLEDDPEIEVIWEASDGQETIDKMHESTPDVLVADIRMPLLTGLEVTQQLKQEDPTLKIIMLTMHDDSEYILKSVQYGADGYLLKDTNKAEFNKAVKMVNSGQKYFSGDISTTIVNSIMSGGAIPTTKEVVSPVASQDYGLTKREKQILSLIYDGVSNKDIADKLDKSIRTIETHRFNIMKKIEVNNITELLKKVDREGLLN